MEKKKRHVVQTSLQSSDDILRDINDWEKYLWYPSVSFNFPRASVFQLWAFMYIRCNTITHKSSAGMERHYVRGQKLTPPAFRSASPEICHLPGLFWKSEDLSSVYQRYVATLLWLTTAIRQDLFLDT